MHSTLNILQQFQQVSLSEMDAVKLLDRVDLKYAFHRQQLDEILQQLTADYRVLTIDDRTISRYETSYFDTPGLGMYLQHHNRKLNRHKVRFRKYADTGQQFFEIKFKSNKDRTIKKRMNADHQPTKIGSDEARFLAKHSPYRADELGLSLIDQYERITLVSNSTFERLTIDTGLTFNSNGRSVSFPGLVIAEVKQSASAQSPFVSLMHRYAIHQLSLSKYCLGIACLYDEIKKNNFKPKMLYVSKICNSEVR